MVSCFKYIPEVETEAPRIQLSISFIVLIKGCL